MLGLDAGHAGRGTKRVVPLWFFMLVVLADWYFFRHALVGSGFPDEKFIDIVVEPGIFLDDVVKKLFILGELVLQIPAIPEIDLILELVDIDALGE